MSFNTRLAAAVLGKKPIGFEEITFDGSPAVGLTPPAVSDPKDRAYFAIIVLETTDANLTTPARFREDGVSPTASVGMPLSHLEKYELQGYDQIANWRIIGTNVDPATASKISVTYYKLGDQ